MAGSLLNNFMKRAAFGGGEGELGCHTYDDRERRSSFLTGFR